MHILVQVGLVAFGGALGSLLRWGVTVASVHLFGTAFPWGTFLINITGSLFLGWFSTMFEKRLLGEGFDWIRADDLQLTVAVGFTGAFTTFSTFEEQTNHMINSGAGWKALTYVIASVVLGLLAVRFGAWLARST